MTLDNAKDLDKILVFLNGQSSTTYFEIEEIKNAATPDKDTAHVTWLIECLHEHPYQIVRQLSTSPHFAKGNYTDTFLKEGGYEEIYNKAAEKLKKDEEKDKLDLLQKRFIYKARYWPFIISGLAFIGTIVSITISIKSLEKKSEQEEKTKEKEAIPQSTKQKVGAPLELNSETTTQKPVQDPVPK